MFRSRAGFALCAWPLLACSGEQAPDQGGASGGAPNGGNVVAPERAFADCGAKIVNASTGAIDRDEYVRQALRWDLETIDCRLGPRYDAVHPGAGDERPRADEPVSNTCDDGYLCKQYQAGPATCTAQGGCYGSDSGQVLYVPADASDVGVDRLQVYGWEAEVHCYAPQPLPGGNSHPDPLLLQAEWQTANSGVLRNPIAMTRSAASWTNDAVIALEGGALVTTGTPTTGSNGAFFKFPAHLVPTSLALSAANEFLFVTVWDTRDIAGRLAVFSMRGARPTAHTWPFHGLLNAGGFEEMKLLGYVDLPFATPTSVAVASDGRWTGPSETAGKSLPEIQFGSCDGASCTCDSGLIAGFARTTGDWSNVVAKRGYAVVASRWENKVAFVDLAPLFSFFRASYFGSAPDCAKALEQFSFDGSAAEPGAQPAADLFPPTFDVVPEQRPAVVSEFSVPHPRAVLAGIRKDRWSKDFYKAYVAAHDGTIHVFSAGRLLYESWDLETNGALTTQDPAHVGTFASCISPTALRFLGLGAGSDQKRASAPPLGSGVLPLREDGASAEPLDGLNNALAIVCRGDREVAFAATWLGSGGVYDRFRDERLGDPVAIDIADRSDIRTIADFDGRKVVSFRFAGLRAPDCSEQPAYPLRGRAECGGEYELPGPVFQISTTNVN